MIRDAIAQCLQLREDLRVMTERAENAESHLALLKAAIKEVERENDRLAKAVHGEAVAEVVSKYGDPEAFGVRELVALRDLQQIAYGTKLYAAPHGDSAQVLVEALESLLRGKVDADKWIVLTVDMQRADETLKNWKAKHGQE